ILSRSARGAHRQHRLDGLKHIRHQHVDRLKQGLPVRGIRTELEMDAEHYLSEGELLLVASVLNEFFALYANLNCFHELRVTTTQGARYQWTPRTGLQHLLRAVWAALFEYTAWFTASARSCTAGARPTPASARRRCTSTWNSGPIRAWGFPASISSRWSSCMSMGSCGRACVSICSACFATPLHCRPSTVNRPWAVARGQSPLVAYS